MILLATPDSINADIAKAIGANWSDIADDLAANPKKVGSFSVMVNIAQAADASVSYTIKLVSRKQSMVSQSVVTAAKGKLA